MAVVEYFNHFINLINKESDKKIGTIQKIKSEPVWGNAFITDDDLEILLNLIPAYKDVKLLKKLFPRNQYFSYHMETLSIPAVFRPDVFVMGGSFNWTWLTMIYGRDGWMEHGQKAIFDETHIRFYDLFVQKYPEIIRMAVNEFQNEFQTVIDNDILIIEFNEQAISPEAVQFAFAENLLKFINKTGD
jgi:hypothetical protein